MQDVLGQILTKLDDYHDEQRSVSFALASLNTEVAKLIVRVESLATQLHTLADLPVRVSTVETRVSEWERRSQALDEISNRLTSLEAQAEAADKHVANLWRGLSVVAAIGIPIALWCAKVLLKLG